MIQNKKSALESKLTIYLVCYQEAEKSNDLKRMVILDPIISDLRDEIGLFQN